MSSNDSHNNSNTQAMNQQEMTKKLHQLTKELSALESVVDQKQKLLAKKRKEVPEACKQLLLEEKMTLLDYFFDAPTKPEKPTSVDISKIINDVETRIDNCRAESDNEKRLLEKIQEVAEGNAKLEEEVQKLAEKLLSGDF